MPYLPDFSLGVINPPTLRDAVNFQMLFKNGGIKNETSFAHLISDERRLPIFFCGARFIHSAGKRQTTPSMRQLPKTETSFS